MAKGRPPKYQVSVSALTDFLRRCDWSQATFEEMTEHFRGHGNYGKLLGILGQMGRLGDQAPIRKDDDGYWRLVDQGEDNASEPVASVRQSRLVDFFQMLDLNAVVQKFNDSTSSRFTAGAEAVIRIEQRIPAEIVAVFFSDENGNRLKTPIPVWEDDPSVAEARLVIASSNHSNLNGVSGGVPIREGTTLVLICKTGGETFEVKVLAEEGFSIGWLVDR